jgi:hypothetical protein
MDDKKNPPTGTSRSFFFFLKREQKFCPDLLIKKEENAQLINGKPSENLYNKNTKSTIEGHKSSIFSWMVDM